MLLYINYIERGVKDLWVSTFVSNQHRELG